MHGTKKLLDGYRIMGTNANAISLAHQRWWYPTYSMRRNESMMRQTLIAGLAAMALMLPASAMAQDKAAPAGATLEFIGKQKADEHFASSLIGANVTNPAGETLGSVNNLMVGPNGELTAAVIGVGGFLGIGEKNVAVPYDALQTTTEDDELKVVLNTTKAELETAQDYRDIDDQPLSVSKRLTDEAKVKYEQAKQGASETYSKAKESVSGTGKNEVKTQ
jgi:sporulation protein YlmC with PRC-barrel domain